MKAVSFNIEDYEYHFYKEYSANSDKTFYLDCFTYLYMALF